MNKATASELTIDMTITAKGLRNIAEKGVEPPKGYLLKYKWASLFPVPEGKSYAVLNRSEVGDFACYAWLEPTAPASEDQLNAIAHAIQEAIRYGVNAHRKRSAASESMIIREICAATSWDKKAVAAVLEKVF
jgi:hypothetical protein